MLGFAFLLFNLSYLIVQRLINHINSLGFYVFALFPLFDTFLLFLRIRYLVSLADCKNAEIWLRDGCCFLRFQCLRRGIHLGQVVVGSRSSWRHPLKYLPFEPIYRLDLFSPLNPVFPLQLLVFRFQLLVFLRQALGFLLQSLDRFDKLAVLVSLN